MSEYDNDHLCSLRAALLDHPIYTHVASVADLRRFMEDHVFAVWDFMSLLKRLQQDMTCIKVPWFPADNAKAARLINDIVIGEETDVGPDGSYVSHLALYLRAMRDIGASTRQFEKFRSLVFVGVPVEVALRRIGAPRHVQAFVAHTMALANSGSTEEVLAAFFYGREDIIPEMFRRLLDTLYGAKHNNDRLRHFIYYIDRHIELDGDSHGPMGRELLEDLVANSPHTRRAGSACRVQQHQSPYRTLERHIEQTAQQPWRGALDRDVRRLTSDPAEPRSAGRPRPFEECGAFCRGKVEPKVRQASLASSN